MSYSTNKERNEEMNTNSEEQSEINAGLQIRGGGENKRINFIRTIIYLMMVVKRGRLLGSRSKQRDITSASLGGQFSGGFKLNCLCITALYIFI